MQAVLRPLALLALLFVPGPAHAQDGHRRVALDLEDCLGADAAAVRRILAAELGGVLVELGGGASEPELTAVSADCGVESAIVVVTQAGTALRFEQRVDLANAAPNARTRLLALSIAELAASTWAAADALPPPAPPPVAAPPAPESPPVAPPPIEPETEAPEPAPEPPPAPPARPLGIRAIGVARVSGSPVHISGGGGLGVEVALPLSLGVGADLRYEQGEADTGPLGDVVLRVAWGTLLGLARPIVDWSSVSIGVGVKLGAAWLEGLPSDGITGATHSGLVFGPAVAAHVALHLGGSGYAHLGLELSWITVGVAGTAGRPDQILASFAGPQIAITAGFEIQPLR